MARISIILTGAVGLMGAIIITTLCLFIMTAGWISPLVSQSVHIWGLFLFLLFFSVAEIPVMIFSIRRIVTSDNPKARYVAMIANTGYTLFAGVYAAPFILLAGQSRFELAIGAFMGALTFVRFITAIIFLSHDKQT